jgi:hypothetical protein
MLMLRAEPDVTPDMAIGMAEQTVIATWENRDQILEIMTSARHLGQHLQNLWETSGKLGRLTQDHTDELVALLGEIGALSDTLSILA